MPITVAKMAAREAPLTVSGGHLGDESINLVYYPNKITLDMQKHLARGLEGTTQFLVEVLKSWDVLDGDEPYPITAESLEKLSSAVLDQIGLAIIHDLRPNS